MRIRYVSVRQIRRLPPKMTPMKTPLTAPYLYDGSAIPTHQPTTLQAGNLTLLYENGLLRYLRFGEQELIRGIYAAVRDQNWGTVPATLRDEHIDQGDDWFHITFVSEHRQGEIHFVWHGEIVGTNDSTIRFDFAGEALTAFQRNRIGFCILHPVNAAGKPVAVEHTDGKIEQSVFPASISPHQPFHDVRVLTHEAAPGLRTAVRMEGDTFETEDQRNWTDASFKTYCTPLAEPLPVLVEAGTRIQQSVTVQLLNASHALQVRQAAPVFSVDAARSQPLPAIGLCAASHDEPLTALQIERLQALHLTHLRFDARPTPQLEAQLRRVWDEAQALGAELELAIHLTNDFRAELQRLRLALEALRVRGRILGFRQGEVSSSLETIEAMRTAFAGYSDPLALGGGTDAFFTQLNRHRPPADRMDVVGFSINPQVHAFDNASLVETLPTLLDVIASARAFTGHAALAVTPITFKMRSNPDALRVEAAASSEVLPRAVDVRQLSLFGAGWVVGSIAYLAQAQAESLTYFETTGWLGVMERAGGAPLPDQFPSIPNSVFPMYHVFADVGDFRGGSVLPAVSSDPLSFSGLALRNADRLRLLLANHTEKRLPVTLSGISGQFAARWLDETTAEAAMRTPELYRLSAGKPIRSDGDLRVDLPPYAVVTLDQKG